MKYFAGGQFRRHRSQRDHHARHSPCLRHFSERRLSLLDRLAEKEHRVRPQGDGSQ
ncbi:unnamed protein product [Nesidiocoris tenuis]|uniref:Uncharacterized protein n=1 Tax=Nesidiocoris tenuis TaxID=355587 RepID=A0A6H5HJ96_9HEMI|nr:unnamed protein product [Nesidiocoris tenuis]